MSNFENIRDLENSSDSANNSVTSAEFFEAKYRENSDPWAFAKSEYESSRYDAIMAALEAKTYERAFEPGCSIGELTLRLAQRCGHVDAMDISATAVSHAKIRCREYPNISFHVGALPHHTARVETETFDLIVFSEIGYYFEAPHLQELGNRLVSQIRTSGTLLAAHWLGTSKDHLLSGDRVHEILSELSGLELERRERHAGFRLDRWRRI